MLHKNPFSVHVFIFRGKRGDLVKLLWWSTATCGAKHLKKAALHGRIPMVVYLR